MKRMFALFVALLLILPMIPTLSADGETTYYVGGDTAPADVDEANWAATFGELNFTGASADITIKALSNDAGDLNNDFFKKLNSIRSLTIDGDGCTIGRFRTVGMPKILHPSRSKMSRQVRLVFKNPI